MPRNGAGVYSLPSGSVAVSGDTALATTHNTPLNDIVTDLNTARPLVAGGTGDTTAAGARTNLQVTASFPSRAAVTSLSIGASVDAFMTLGYAAEGDGGGAIYARVVAEPSHEGKVQSADLAWWEIVPGVMGLDVRQFGAADNTDSTTAFTNCLAACVALQSAHRFEVANGPTYAGSWDKGVVPLNIPAGTFELDLTSAHLWDFSSGNAIRGITIRGAGADVSFLRISAGSAKRIFNNDDKVQSVRFEHFTVHDETGNANLFYYCNSTGTAKRHYMDGIITQFMEYVSINGTANGDHLRCDNCRIDQVPNGSRGVYLNNPQAVDHQFTGCEITELAGKGIEVDAGGALTWIGGSITVYKGGRFIDIDGPGASIGAGNNSFDFYGPKIEFRDAGTGTDPQGMYLSAPAVVNFIGGAYQTDELSGTRTLAPFVIDRGRMNVIGASTWGSNYYVQIDSQNNDASTDLPPEVCFTNCHLTAQLDDIVTITAAPGGTSFWNAYGRAYARGCFGIGDESPVDVSINAERGGRSVSMDIKRAYFTAGNSQAGGLPANGSPLTCNIPVHAKVVEVGFDKQSGSGDPNVTYRWVDGNSVVIWTDGTPVSNGDTATHSSGRLDPTRIIDSTTTGAYTFENTTASATTAEGTAWIDYIG